MAKKTDAQAAEQAAKAAPASKAKNKENRLRVTLVKSSIGCPTRQKRTVKALGLLKVHATVEHPDNPSVRGMIFKVQHLVKVEEV